MVLEKRVMAERESVRLKNGTDPAATGPTKETSINDTSVHAKVSRYNLISRSSFH